MALRKASSYSKKRVRPYTRTSKNKTKAYIKSIPYSKIVKLTAGDHGAYDEGKFPFEISYVTDESVQIRDNALEACRMYLTKMLDEQAIGQYFLAVKVFPHHMVRENKSAGGMAGADRISTGMTQAFGVVIGRSAIVPKGKEVFFVACANEKAARAARLALNSIKSKLPCKGRLVFTTKKHAVAAE
jgi:large subunit ribosomal protein L10e